MNQFFLCCHIGLKCQGLNRRLVSACWIEWASGLISFSHTTKSSHTYRTAHSPGRWEIPLDSHIHTDVRSKPSPHTEKMTANTKNQSSWLKLQKHFTHQKIKGHKHNRTVLGPLINRHRFNSSHWRWDVSLEAICHESDNILSTLQVLSTVHKLKQMRKNIITYTAIHKFRVNRLIYF